MLKNPYLRIAIASVVATYLAPTIVNKLIVPESSSSDTMRNTAMTAGVYGASTALVFVLLEMTTGKSAAP